MSDLPRTPRQVRAAVILMWTVLPFGLIITAINFVAFVQTRAFLPDAPVTFDKGAIDVALRQFGEFGPRRILTIATFFVVGAFAFAALGEIARRGARRRPSGVMLLTGALIATYAVCLSWAYEHDPINDFRYEVLPVDAVGVSNTVPWAMDALAPHWYYGTLALTSIVAGAAQAVGGFLLTRPESTAWIGDRRGDDEGAGATGKANRRGGILLVLTPAVAALYWVIVTIAGVAANDDGVTSPGSLWGSVFVITVYTVAFGAVTLPWVFGGLRLLKNRVRPGLVMCSGAMTIPYLLVVRFLCLDNPLSQSMLGDHTPDTPTWYPPALAVFAAVAIGWLTTNLITLAGTWQRDAVR